MSDADALFTCSAPLREPLAHCPRHRSLIKLPLLCQSAPLRPTGAILTQRVHARAHYMQLARAHFLQPAHVQGEHAHLPEMAHAQAPPLSAFACSSAT